MSIKYTPHLCHSHWRKALVSLARSPARARAYSLWNATAEGCRKVMKWKRQPNKESPQWQRKSPIPRFTTLLLVCRSTPLCPRPKSPCGSDCHADSVQNQDPTPTPMTLRHVQCPAIWVGCHDGQPMIPYSALKNYGHGSIPLATKVKIDILYNTSEVRSEVYL